MSRLASRVFSSALRDARGVAAVEFALILPVILTLFFGMVSVESAVLGTHKIELAANSLADLAARKLTDGDNFGQAAITDADINELLSAAKILLSPFPATDLHIDIYQIAVKKLAAVSGQTLSNYAATAVWWANNKNGLRLLDCGVALSAGEGGKNQLPQEFFQSDPSAERDRYLIVTHVSYGFKPTYSFEAYSWKKAPTWTIFRAGYAQTRTAYGSGEIQSKLSNNGGAC